LFFLNFNSVAGRHSSTLIPIFDFFGALGNFCPKTKAETLYLFYLLMIMLLPTEGKALAAAAAAPSEE
jgi:hypothetical protein